MAKERYSRKEIMGFKASVVKETKNPKAGGKTMKYPKTTPAKKRNEEKSRKAPRIAALGDRDLGQ